MSKGCRTATWVGTVTLVFLAPVTPVEGQTIRGRVIDAGTQVGVEGAALVVATDQRTVMTVASDSLGSFLLRLPGTGTFSVHAERIGYVRSEPAAFQVGVGAAIDIQIALEPVVLPVDDVVVTGIRSNRLPPAATVEGLHARRAVLPRVGSRRVFLHDDFEMHSVLTVGQLLDRWIPFGGEQRCIDWFVNGIPMHPRTDPREFVREMTTSMLEGVEYYRDESDAPLELHGQGWCLLQDGGGATWSIIAVWFKR